MLEHLVDDNITLPVASPIGTGSDNLTPVTDCLLVSIKLSSLDCLNLEIKVSSPETYTKLISGS